MFLTEVVINSSLPPEVLFPILFILFSTIIIIIPVTPYLRKRYDKQNKNETSKKVDEKKSVDKASNPDSNKKYCDYCGTEMEDNAKKCTSCGAKRRKK